MHNDNILGKIRLKGHNHLSRQGNFRHQYDNLPPSFADFARHFDINLCLTAAGNPFQQKALICSGLYCRFHGCYGRLLVSGEFHFRAHRLRFTVTVPHNPAVFQSDKSICGQRF